MGINYGALPIVGSGLYLALDASDFHSYPGSGTTWNDLTRNRNATKEGSPTYVNDDLADYFSFDDGTEYFDFNHTLSDFTESTGKSCCMWIMNGGNSAEARIINAGLTGTGGAGATGFSIGVTGSGTANQPFSFYR